MKNARILIKYKSGHCEDCGFWESEIVRVWLDDTLVHSHYGDTFFVGGYAGWDAMTEKEIIAVVKAAYGSDYNVTVEFEDLSSLPGEGVASD